MSKTTVANGTTVVSVTPPHSSPRPATTAAAPQAQTQGNALLPAASQHRANGQLPNTPLAASVISALLGGLFFSSAALLLAPHVQALGGGKWTAAWARPQLALYAAAMGAFHLSEFWTTAGWNPNKLSVDAFLLNNGRSYHFAHIAGIVEYLVSSVFWPGKFDSFWNTPWFCAGAVGVLIIGQTLRSLAMIHASRSFSHVVKVIKHDDHTLVTTGVYSLFRHPSYVGFFYWALATQVLLGNVASTLAFALVLGRFFYARIKDEERHLVRFFGDQYVQYRKRVGTGLPFSIPV